MTRDNDDLSDEKDKVPSRSYNNPTGNRTRSEPGFGDFNHEVSDEYEEPDRDTDSSSWYPEEDTVEEEEFEGSFLEENEEDEEVLFATEENDTQPMSNLNEPDPSAYEDADEPFEEEDYLDEEENTESSWPLGLIAVGVIALALLVVGAYGVMQERTRTQEELRELRATLATSANPQDMGANRETLLKLQLSYDELAAEAEALELENRRLSDTVVGLEAQLGIQQAVLTKTIPAPIQDNPDTGKPKKSAPPSPTAPTAAAAPKPVKPDPVTVSSAEVKPASNLPAVHAAVSKNPVTTGEEGSWFVNFASYSSRDMADSWAVKLRPVAGKVVVVPSSASNGKNLYRVRVVGLGDKNAAQEVARKLEAAFQVSKLWVGKE